MKKTIFIIIAILLASICRAEDVEKLVSELPNSAGAQKYELYKKIITEYYTRNIDSARIFAEQYLSYSSSSKDPDNVSLAYKHIGASYFYEGDLNNAEKFFGLSMEIAARNNNKELEAAAANNLGIVKTQKSEYNDAIEYFNKALKYYELESKNKEVSMIVLNIGNIHYNTEDYEKALDYFFEVVELATQNEAKPTLAMAYNNIGNIYEHLDSLERSLEYHNKSYKIKQEFNDIRGLANSLNSMASIHRKMGDNKKALFKAKQALAKQLEIGDKHGIITTKNTIGKIYHQIGQLDSAIEYLQKSLEMSGKLNFIEYEKDNLHTLSEYYEEKENYKMAYLFYKRYKAISDSILTLEEKRSLSDLSAKFEKDQMKHIISNLEEESKSKETMQLMLIVFVFLVILITFIIYLQFRTKAKANDMLEEKNKQIEKQKLEFERINIELLASNERLIALNENMLISQKELKETNATKDKFFSIVAHDLKNSIAAFLTSSELITHYYDKLDKERILHQLNRMNSGAMNLRILLENLIQWANSKTGRLKPELEEVNIQRIVDQSVAINEHSALNKNISLIKSVPNDLTALADPNMLKTVLRNLISNSIKFTEQGGIIEISSFARDGKVIISVKDSGIGMTRQEIEKLFKLDSQLRKKGTSNETGTGLGLIISKEFIEYNSGNLFVESEVGKGSTFSITLKNV